MNPSVCDFNCEKFKQVAHLIIQMCGTSPNVGKTVLYKLLYLTDFDYYEIHSKNITGEQYRKKEHGPVPIHCNNIFDQLIKENKIEHNVVQYHGKQQNKYFSLKKPELNLLSADELDHIEKTVNTYSNMNADRISAYSHLDAPWYETPDKELISYDLVHIRDPITSVIDEEEEDDLFLSQQTLSEIQESHNEAKNGDLMNESQLLAELGI